MNVDTKLMDGELNDLHYEKLIDHPDIEVYKPMKVTVIGFFITWLVVFFILGITVFIANIGA
jgi:hypothetical protein